VDPDFYILESLNFPVVCINEEVQEILVGFCRRSQMDERIFDLDHLASSRGEFAQFLIGRYAHVPY